MIKDAMAGTEWHKDDNGFLVSRGVLARTGIQNYRGMEVGDEADPLRIVRVYRPHSEVFDRQSMLSFEDRPVTVDHPNEAVTADNWKQYAVGEVRNVRREGDYLVGTVIVKDAEAIRLIEGGLVELSNGYSNTLDMTPGITPGGESYDAVQRHIRGNHVALVQRARCGDACRLTGDENIKEGGMDELKKQLDEAQARVKELEDEISEKAKEMEGKDARIAALGDAVRELETTASATTDSAALQTALDAADAEIKRLSSPEHIAAEVKAWAAMMADGVKIAPSVTVDSAATAIEYQRAVLRAALDSSDANRVMILAVTGGKTICDASDDSVSSAFRLMASLPQAAPKQSQIGDLLTGKTVTADSSEVMGAAMFHSRMMNGFNGGK